MGVDTNAILAYGYDIGGGEPWRIREATGANGEIELDWYDPDSDGFIELCRERLMAGVGITARRPPRDETGFERERAAREALGVEFETYCSDGQPMYLLAAHAIIVARGDIKTIDLDALRAVPGREGWDAKLAAAVAALGITPTQDRPRWLLCSYWG
ncbi:hypothetical protein [Embleya hyalina]|uniref:Uncharacterized protein n=1 Tax=Embleya hyalina TaxID=516124 RepID=A0A401Z5V3_9ACTN|nr:hypothetical protein [Embleya hyalina]GCE02198.1 hypothetical protein EHYA_09975 [Embleya hyalina]